MFYDIIVKVVLIFLQEYNFKQWQFVDKAESRVSDLNTNIINDLSIIFANDWDAL